MLGRHTTKSGTLYHLPVDTTVLLYTSLRPVTPMCDVHAQVCMPRCARATLFLPT